MIKLLNKLDSLHFEILQQMDSYEDDKDKETELLLAINDLEDIIKSLSTKQVYADFQTLIK